MARRAILKHFTKPKSWQPGSSRVSHFSPTRVRAEPEQPFLPSQGPFAQCVPAPSRTRRVWAGHGRLPLGDPALLVEHCPGVLARGSCSSVPRSPPLTFTASSSLSDLKHQSRSREGAPGAARATEKLQSSVSGKDSIIFINP